MRSPVTPKSPVSSSSPWPINSNNFNALPERFRARRKSSFEGGSRSLSKLSHYIKLHVAIDMIIYHGLTLSGHQVDLLMGINNEATPTTIVLFIYFCNLEVVV